MSDIYITAPVPTPAEMYEIGHAHGTARERERIIKLLEESFDDTILWRQIKWSPDAYEGFNKQELIALINGEQK